MENKQKNNKVLVDNLNNGYRYIDTDDALKFYEYRIRYLDQMLRNLSREYGLSYELENNPIDDHIVIRLSRRGSQFVHRITVKELKDTDIETLLDRLVLDINKWIGLEVNDHHNDILDALRYATNAIHGLGLKEDNNMGTNYSNYERGTRSGHGFIGKAFGIRTITRLEITNVVFNDPATIVFWSDGTKIVVKCGEDDVYDPEKGMAMAIAKRALGNQGNYYEVFKEWLPVKGTAIKEPEVVNDIDTCKPVKKIDISLNEYCVKNNITKNKAYGMIKRGELEAFKDRKGKWRITI